ncbi:NAD-dependent epimerase/dehydratase family protein [Intrasporangium sp.]|uniref:NAD-dependent epimerase/dehydratase family protein n=1 Tax=Intrasporangium sp. TaxID=1925024 RepID=UPI00293A3BF3|nr:NAD-dependent epimerase/dehydratase family protein [Intrasporangium sp.]MDV3219979.1 NAD-dependent epimerase/dehydratase family protein [Intrasporangium sp.]
MAHHLVLGAGGIGRTTAAHLASRGHSVTLVSRSGRGEALPGVTRQAADAADAARLTELATGASSIVNAINPPKYTTWDTDWPPVAKAVLVATERSGAGLVTVSNLYAYGLVEAPMREDLELRPNGHKGRLRAAMWRDAVALHDQGRIRATELRASDYFGPEAQSGTSILNEFVIKRAATGKGPFLPLGRADAPHTWTYLDDIGALAATLATDDRSWGRVWHVPSSAAKTIREVAADVARLTGQTARPVRVLPRPLGTALGAVVPLMRELRETRHQFERPFVLDSSLAEETFGLQPTAWEVALKATVAGLLG